MSEDWNKPSLTSTYTDVLTELKDRGLATAKMDYTGSTNLPSGVIRWSSTSSRFEMWNGSTWVALQAEIAAHIASTSNPHNVTTTQIGAATAGALSGHTGATNNPHSVTTAQIGALRVDQNLNDVPDKAAARSILGVPSTADLSSHSSNTNNPHSVTASQVGALRASNNLSDVANASTSRDNLSAAESGENWDITSLNACNSVAASGNLELKSQAFGSSVYIKPSGGAAWEFTYTGKVVPYYQPDYTVWPTNQGGYTTRRSLNPAAATPQYNADAINTLYADLIATGIFK